MGRLPAKSFDTTRAAKCVLSSDCTITSAPGRPTRISSATCSGFTVVTADAIRAGDLSLPRHRMHWPSLSRAPNALFLLAIEAVPVSMRGMSSSTDIPVSDAQLEGYARRALEIEAEAVKSLLP